jgi:hypothetical protein
LESDRLPVVLALKRGGTGFTWNTALSRNTAKLPYTRGPSKAPAQRERCCNTRREWLRTATRGSAAAASSNGSTQHQLQHGCTQ